MFSPGIMAQTPQPVWCGPDYFWLLRADIKTKQALYTLIRLYSGPGARSRHDVGGGHTCPLANERGRQV